MDFSMPDDVRALQERTREFIATQVIPLESRPVAHEHGPSEALRKELVARAREAGLLTPHASVAMGGLGPSVTGESIVMRIFSDMRAFRIHDGPSEVHRWSMARKIVHQAERAE